MQPIHHSYLVQVTPNLKSKFLSIHFLILWGKWYGECQLIEC